MISRPAKGSFFPTLRALARQRSSPMGKLRSSRILSISRPTAPVAPSIVTFGFFMACSLLSVISANICSQRVLSTSISSYGYIMFLIHSQTSTSPNSSLSDSSFISIRICSISLLPNVLTYSLSASYSSLLIYSCIDAQYFNITTSFSLIDISGSLLDTSVDRIIRHIV